LGVQQHRAASGACTDLCAVLQLPPCATSTAARLAHTMRAWQPPTAACTPMRTAPCDLPSPPAPTPDTDAPAHLNQDAVARPHHPAAALDDEITMSVLVEHRQLDHHLGEVPPVEVHQVLVLLSPGDPARRLLGRRRARARRVAGLVILASAVGGAVAAAVDNDREVGVLRAVGGGGGGALGALAGLDGRLLLLGGQQALALGRGARRGGADRRHKVLDDGCEQGRQEEEEQV